MNTRRYSARSAVGPITISLSAFCFAFLVGCAGVQPAGEPGPGRFEIGFIGDQQYDPESEAKFPHLMDEVNRANLAFVVHIGDFKGGSSQCDDGIFKQRKEQFDASRHPFVYTPGDNDWLDCYRPKAGGYDPVERLAKLREIFFQGNQSLGQRKLTVKRQSDSPQFSKFRENVRWTYGNVLFVTLHMVGSNNNLGRVPEADAEYRERNAANLAWLKEAFDVARREGNRAVAIFMQANPLFEYRLPSRRERALRVRPAPKRPFGFTDFMSALEVEVLAFGKTVVLLHGDTHYFRVDKPLFRSKEAGPRDWGRLIENFTRVETFGFPEGHWVRVIVDLNDSHVFTFKEQIVDKNRFGKP
ncbi:MAG: metallophosphoesterase [Betaproteobacteria bacterium]|nr:metallophosphoesterase [Betaproteobacteria bacterium]